MQLIKLMGKNFKIIFFLQLLFFSLLLCGQSNDMLKQYLTVENGLSHNEVTSIVQDNNGFIWMGTRGGLNRYDGYEFKVNNQVPEDSNSLVNPSIETLFIDSKGNIWIGTKSGGVSKYNPKNGQFKNIVNNYSHDNPVMPAHRILSFYESRDGKIWIGTWARGLYIYDEKTNTAKQYLERTRINSIKEADSRIFAGSNHRPQGLFEYNQEADSFEIRTQISCQDMVFDEARNVLWIVGGDNIGAGKDDNGLTRFDLRNNKTVSYRIKDSSLSSSKLPHSYYSVHLNKSGKIWIGTWGTGLYIFTPENESFERYYIYPDHRQNQNKDYDAILEIFQDRNSNIWLGTNGGGACLLSDKLGFNTVGYDPEPNRGLTNTRIMTVLEDQNKNLWIGTVGDGLIWSNDRVNFYPVENPTLDNKSRFFVIKYLYEDLESRIWVGTNLGTYEINFKSGKPVMENAAIKYGSPEFEYTAVSFLDAGDYFMVGTLTEGLVLFDEKDNSVIRQQRIHSNSDRRMKSNRISYLLKDSRDKIWIGSYNGLHVFQQNDTSVYLTDRLLKIKGTFTGNIVTCITEDLKGNIWVGTPNGLNRLSLVRDNEYELTYFTEKDGLASNFIKGIASDLRGDIWFSTNAGISKYATQEDRWINFDETDGVLGKSFTEASVHRNSKGEIFFGGTQGLTFFKPDEIIEHKQSPKPVFTRLSILNQAVEIGKEYDSNVILKESISNTSEIKITHRQNKIEIQFSALDFDSQGKSNYMYFLENFDKEWTEIGKRRFVIFNNLKPGSYILKIKSANDIKFGTKNLHNYKLL